MQGRSPIRRGVSGATRSSRSSGAAGCLKIDGSTSCAACRKRTRRFAPEPFSNFHDRSGVAVSPDRKRAVSVSGDNGTVKLLDLSSGKVEDELDLAGSGADCPSCVAFLTSRSFAVGTHRSVVLVFEPAV